MIKTMYSCIVNVQENLKEMKKDFTDALTHKTVYYKGAKHIVMSVDVDGGTVELSPLEGDIVYITVPIIELSV